MKKLMLLLTLLASHSAFAADQEWISINSPHPLWDALKVNVKKSDDGTFQRETKAAGGVSCTKTSLHSTNPILPAQVQTHCTFSEQQTPEQIFEFYKALNVEPQDTSGAYTEYKIVDKMIVTGSNEDEYDESSDYMYRIYLEHPCQSVQSFKEANACMTFWGEEILPDFEGENDIAVVAVTKTVREKALKVAQWAHGDYKLFKDRIQQADYIGIMNEHQDEDHLYYFSIQKGINVIPLEALDINMADLSYTFEDAYKDAPDKERKAFLEYFNDHLFLGKEGVGHFGDYVSEYFDYFLEELGDEQLIDEP